MCDVFFFTKKFLSWIVFLQKGFDKGNVFTKSCYHERLLDISVIDSIYKKDFLEIKLQCSYSQIVVKHNSFKSSGWKVPVVFL